ncbi:MAG: MBL fold hydrolase [Flavobacteriales bacterium]|nr:MBL fold hydrolase [Flavobacteriales bacterium]
MKIKKFTFNSFQENTYIISSRNECMIIDPGCSNKFEQNQIISYIQDNNLEPKELLNTHCHIDHIFGNQFVSEEYQLTAKMHKKDFPLLEKAEEIAKIYNVNLSPPPLNVDFIEENDIIHLGDTSWKVILTPGHSPGHICFFNEPNQKLIAGDVLFFMSIGRTDLPGGNHEELIKSIQSKIFILDNQVEVLCGHGQNTSIGYEKINNPYVGLSN